MVVFREFQFYWGERNGSSITCKKSVKTIIIQKKKSWSDIFLSFHAYRTVSASPLWQGSILLPPTKVCRVL